MLHYHGTPITPRTTLGRLAGRSFCVSFASPQDVVVAHEIGQSVMLDNGAFTFWRTGRGVSWPDFYEWAERWLEWPTTWAVIPDTIEGGEVENDRLVDEWKERGLPRGAPVWHMHEPVDRLLRLAAGFERVCIGSSAQFASVGDAAWRRRMDEAMNALCGSGPVPVWLHMLRGMALAGSEYPFASVDSTDVGRNHNRAGNDALEMALRWDGRNCRPRWSMREQLTLAS